VDLPTRAVSLPLALALALSFELTFALTLTLDLPRLDHRHLRSYLGGAATA
jgi:hypothetical protein